MTKKPKKTKKPLWPISTQRMTAREYVAALDELGLTVASQRTALALGIGLRQCQRLAGGDARIPGPVERLLALYQKHRRDLPPDPVEQG